MRPGQIQGHGYWLHPSKNNMCQQGGVELLGLQLQTITSSHKGSNLKSLPWLTSPHLPPPLPSLLLSLPSYHTDHLARLQICKPRFHFGVLLPGMFLLLMFLAFSLACGFHFQFLRGPFSWLSCQKITQASLCYHIILVFFSFAYIILVSFKKTLGQECMRYLKYFIFFPYYSLVLVNVLVLFGYCLFFSLEIGSLRAGILSYLLNIFSV